MEKQAVAIRMKDIAAELGVSTMTVSKVLRGKGRISEDTRKRILQRVDELGYRPNLAARGLISGRRSLVGLIVPDLIHPFFASLAKQVSNRMRDAGFSVAISSTQEDPAVEQAELSTFLAQRMDAIIVASSASIASRELLHGVDQSQVPILLIDRMMPGSSLPFVGSDDRAIGELAARHLLERGYRRIGHIGGPAVSTAELRLNGLQAELKRAGVPITRSLFIETPSSDESGERSGHGAMRALLALRRPPDAVFCYNDILAYGAMRAILEGGLRIPEDVALIGVSNLASLVYWDTAPVALTSIDQNIEVLAASIAEQALSLIERSAIGSTRRLVPGHLVFRKST